MSAASQLKDSAPDEAEADGPASARPTEPRPWPLPVPPMRDALSTLDEEDFDFHDTIPAPPWLDDASEGELQPLPALPVR
jgi:hypothetical protein